ncbi:MAG: nucleoside hydrolase [Planctomycetes bacterium]|nr:nucleoside hydrolase [Planctomycetota bacterium]
MKPMLEKIALLLFSVSFGQPMAIAETGSVSKSISAKIPVIYDSDIGDDIDDTWALCMLLKSPELDLKLVVGDQGKTEYRTKLFAKLLEIAQRTDVPIGIGLEVNLDGTGDQQGWVEDYDLKSYPGTIHEDGVQAIIDTIMNSPVPITVLAVGPLPNIREALKREPRIAEKARFVGMHGSVRKGYGGSGEVSAEYNVRVDAKACQAALSAPWDIVITPLDTCGLVQLQGEKYASIRDCNAPLTKALIENYTYWIKEKPWYKESSDKRITQSSILFDTVAVYLVFSQDLCEMETLPIRVTEDGKTVIDDSARKMRVATEWKDLGRFEDLLVERLTAE